MDPEELPLGAATEEIIADLPGVPLRLLKVRNLASLLDRDALLRDDRAPEPPYWAHIWPAARALARLVAQADAPLRGRRVIELGCGLGLPGVTAARRGAAVTLSDRNMNALRFAARNLARNGLPGMVVGMDWRLPCLRGEFGLCLAADVTYDPVANDGLIEFLDAHLAVDGEVWLAESVRAEEQRLPQLLSKHFETREQRIAEHEDGHRVWVRVLQGRRRR